MDENEPVWVVPKLSRLEQMAERAAYLADLKIQDLRNETGYINSKELREMTRGELIAEILEDEFLLDD